MPRSLSLVVLGCLLGALPAQAAAPPARLTAVQQAKVKQGAALFAQASALARQGKEKQAVEVLRRALALEREVFGQVRVTSGGDDWLGTLADSLEDQGEWKEALAAWKERHDAIRAAWGKGDWRVVDARVQVRCCEIESKLTSAQRATLGKARSLMKDAIKQYTQGKPMAAVPLAEKSLALFREVLGEKHRDCIASLHNLGAMCAELGETVRALGMARQAVSWTRELLGERHPSYAASLNVLGLLYKDLGKYNEAMPLLRQALKVNEEVLGARNAARAEYLNNLANLHQVLNDYRAAVPLLQLALEVTRETLGTRSHYYAASLNNLAFAYRRAGDHKRALDMLKEALAATKAAGLERHPDHATNLDNLAALYQEMGDHKNALSLLEQARKLRREVLGEKHPHYASSLGSLAWHHEATGDRAEALRLYQQALKLRKEVQGERHPDYAKSLHDLADLYQGMGKVEQARDLVEQALAITRAVLRDSASVQSDRQQLAAAQGLRHRLDLYLSLPEPEGKVPGSYRHVLASKGAVLRLQQERRLFARLQGAASRPKVRLLAESLQQATRSLAALANAPVTGSPAQRRRQMEALTQQKESLEAELAKLAAGFGAARRQSEPTSEDICRALPEGVALVDYLFYTRHDNAQADSKQRHKSWLTCFVVRRDGVVRIDLGAGKAVEEAVTSWRQTLGKKRFGPADPGKTLRKLIWAPLQKHLAGARTVLISPDGALGKIPFAALPGAKPGTYLVEEKAALAVVPVPAALPELLRPVKKEARLKPSLLVVGDVSFDSSEVSPASADERGAPRGTPAGWTKLPATQAEASAVKDSFARLFKGGTATDLREEEASKKAVRAGLGKHRYVHLATHGFFAPPELKSALDEGGRGDGLFARDGLAGWHPLLLSGVVLAGANREPKPGEEDGVLTALEISEMDLGQCEMAVLSACETGLGQVAGGEGLLGLQRAFAVAGARSTITSLWKVDDKATQELMTAFYKVWWDRKKVVSRVEALREAQLAMLREGRKRGMSAEDDKEKDARLPPYYWAAFVLSGDWR